VRGDEQQRVCTHTLGAAPDSRERNTQRPAPRGGGYHFVPRARTRKWAMGAKGSSVSQQGQAQQACAHAFSGIWGLRMGRCKRRPRMHEGGALGHGWRSPGVRDSPRGEGRSVPARKGEQGVVFHSCCVCVPRSHINGGTAVQRKEIKGLTCAPLPLHVNGGGVPCLCEAGSDLFVEGLPTPSRDCVPRSRVVGGRQGKGLPSAPACLRPRSCTKMGGCTKKR
jgi:hypothetical protein